MIIYYHVCISAHLPSIYLSLAHVCIITSLQSHTNYRPPQFPSCSCPPPSGTPPAHSPHSTVVSSSTVLSPCLSHSPTCNAVVDACIVSLVIVLVCYFRLAMFLCSTSNTISANCPSLSPSLSPSPELPELSISTFSGSFRVNRSPILPLLLKCVRAWTSEGSLLAVMTLLSLCCIVAGSPTLYLVS